MSQPTPLPTPRTGELRKLQKHGWLGTVQLAVFVLSMLLPMPSAHSDYFGDLDNDGIPEQHADDEGQDTDNDGIKDGFEIYVSFTDPLNWDSNNNGYSDGDEYHQSYGVNYWSSTAMNVQGTVTFADFDGDGTPNWQDSLPVDGLNGMGDRDADGIWDMFDSYPDDFWNGDPWMGQPHFNYNGTEYAGFWMDSDMDNIPDAADMYPNDSYNGTYTGPTYTNWSGNYWINGLETYLSGTYSSWDNVNDSDYDGIPDIFDPYTADSTNNTSWWNGNWWIDGVEQHFNGVMARSGWGDADYDGIPDNVDPYPYYASNNTSWWSGEYYVNGGLATLGGAYNSSTSLNDSDYDGIYDLFDPYPNDSTNNTAWWGGGEFIINNGSTWLTPQYFGGSSSDLDYDGIPDALDPYPYDPYNGNYWSGAYAFVDGTYSWFGGAYSSQLSSTMDSDGDGIWNYFDPYPNDANNNTSWWNGGDFLINGSTVTFGLSAYATTNAMDWEDYDGDGLPNSLDSYVWFSGNNAAGWRDLVLSTNPFSGNVPSYITQDMWLDEWFGQEQAQRGAPLYLTVEGLIDSDGDGIRDILETYFGLNPDDPSDASVTDSNGYTRLHRYQAGQHLGNDGDPLQDWAGDGVPNLWKMRYEFSLTDPTVAWQDNDADGWINIVEYMRGTNPWVPDEAPQSLREMLEAQLAGWNNSPGDGSGGPGGGGPAPGVDSDGDGVDDLTEQQNGTDPNDASSVFAASSATCPEPVSTG